MRLLVCETDMLLPVLRAVSFGPKQRFSWAKGRRRARESWRDVGGGGWGREFGRGTGTGDQPCGDGGAMSGLIGCGL